jgi:hypothetical protein
VAEDKSFIDKLHEHLFSEQGNLPRVFDEKEREIVLRFRAAFTKWLEEPHLRDADLVNFCMNQFGISQSQAYRDLATIKILVGNVKNAAKDFQRYRASEMILKGFETARTADSATEVKQAMAMIRAGEALVKVHKLDKDELENFKWDEIIPLELEPTTDISVIGRKRVPDLQALKDKLRRKYGVQTVVDVQYTEMNHGKEEDLL